MVVGRFRFTGCPPAFRRCTTTTLMVYTGVATKVILPVFFITKRHRTKSHIEKALSLFLKVQSVGRKNCNTHIVWQKFCCCKSNQKLSNKFSRKLTLKLISMYERKRRVRFFVAKMGKEDRYGSFHSYLFSYSLQSQSFLYKRGETFLPQQAGRDGTVRERTGRYGTIRDEIGEG